MSQQQAIPEVSSSQPQTTATGSGPQKSVRVERYNPERRRAWNDFLSGAKNAVFLFQRDYMEYHSDRFVDHSLLLWNGDALVAVLPANEREGVLYSHGGLTFGGFIVDHRMRTPLMLDVLDAVLRYLGEAGIRRLVYKAVPHIYHDYPAEEDLYALLRHEARLFRRDVSSAVYLPSRQPYSSGRKWSLKRSRNSGVEVGPSDDFHRFMEIETENLRQRHNANPTHTAEEIERLALRFPDNIKLYVATQGPEMCAGVVVYESRNVAHAQYIGSTEAGKNLGAVDLIIDHLLENTYKSKRYFDFGISTEEAGRFLNVGLIQNKESYGARAIVHDFYELDVPQP